MAQGAAQTAGEGFVLLPVSVITLSPVTDTDTDGVFQRRSIMPLLPLVFLAYSVAGLASRASSYTRLGVVPLTLLMQECLSLPSLMSMRGE